MRAPLSKHSVLNTMHLDSVNVIDSTNCYQSNQILTIHMGGFFELVPEVEHQEGGELRSSRQTG